MERRGEYGSVRPEEMPPVESSRYTAPEDRIITLELPDYVTPNRLKTERNLRRLTNRIGRVAGLLSRDDLKIDASIKVTPEARIQGILAVNTDEAEAHAVAQLSSEALGGSWRISRPDVVGFIPKE